MKEIITILVYSEVMIAVSVVLKVVTLDKNITLFDVFVRGMEANRFKK